MPSDLRIGNSILSVRDTYCIESGSCFEAIPGLKYIRKENPRLWLYVHITDRCNAECPFCVNGGNNSPSPVVDPDAFAKALEMVEPFVYGISFTGGEPLLYPELLDELVGITDRIVSPDVEIDTTTNGTNFDKLVSLKHFDRIFSVHISRHLVSQEENNALMKHRGIPDNELKAIMKGMKDPGKLVFNCVLHKGGVETCSDVASYLDNSISVGIRNNSFITMFRANDFCRENYVSPYDFPVISDSECEKWNAEHPDAHFTVWNRHSDHEFCHCLSGHYENPYGNTRFYFRCPGENRPKSLCRQLLYTSDNILQDGFGSDCTVLWDGSER